MQDKKPECPSWVKDKKLSPNFKKIECPVYDEYKDYKQDNGCYVLIKIVPNTKKIHLAVCNYNHEILAEFIGNKPQDIWSKLFKYEEKNKLNWFTRKEHIAYLGKELKKAEIALSMGTDYYQE